MPTNLSPWGGQVIVATQDNTFTWQSDGTQAGYYIEYARNISGATVYNTSWQTSSLSRHVFPANTFTNTYEYKWRVKIRNNAGQESAFSDWAVFRAGNPATLTITYPYPDMVTLNAVPVYQHVYNSPNGYYQVAYRYRLFTGTTWDYFDSLTAEQQESYTWDQLEALATGEILWDSGKVESTATSVEQPSDKLKILQYWYKVQCTIWDNAGNEVTSDIRTFGLLVDSIPKIPVIISATPDPDNGRNVIVISNPTPDPGQIGVGYNRLYRKNIDGSWELVHDNIINGIGYDTTCRSSKQEEYAVSAVGTNGIESSKSTSAYSTCVLDSYWLTNETTKETVKLKANPKWGRMYSERNRTEEVPVDSKYPTVLYSPVRFYRGSFQATLLKPTNMTWSEYIAQIRRVLDADSPTPIIFRSPFGDLLKVYVYDLEIHPTDRMDKTREISFGMVEAEEAVLTGGFSYDNPPTPLDTYWVIDTTTGKGFRLYAEPQWDGFKIEQDSAEIFGLSSQMPTLVYGSKKAIRGGFSGLITDSLVTNGLTLAEEVERLRELIDGKEKKPVLFRTPAGESFLVDVYGFSYELFNRIGQARRVSFEFVEVGGA